MRRHRLVRLVEAGLDRAHTRLLVAVSGGPDSTALLAALAELAGAKDLQLTAAYVDHGLRGAEGAREAACVAALAALHGARFLARAVAVEPGPDLESRARRARYAALHEMAAEAGASGICTGHTRDDQVETVLFRLLRGAGRRGLGGMRPARGMILRPLLAATRADVRRYLADRGLAFAIDRTNADLGRTRNRIRRLLVPFLEEEFNPRLGPAVAALAARLRDEEDFLAVTAALHAERYRDGDALRAGVAAEPAALARRIVRAWLAARVRRPVSAVHVERVMRLARGDGRGAVAVPGPARVVREHDRLVCRPGRQAEPVPFHAPIAPGESVAHPAGAWRLSLSTPRPRAAGEERAPSAAVALFDADALPDTIVVRSPAPGDRITLLAGGTRKLQNVLVDAKVPREQRAAVAVLVGGGAVLWVAGLARGQGAAIGPTTRRVVAATLGRNV